jgi:antitoxin (DNA-binding transcriptional repressor) of toxin-antitoxin stability system
MSVCTKPKRSFPVCWIFIQDGEEVIIHRHGKPVARLAPVHQPDRSPFGAMRGEFQMKEGWERPLTDEEADAFWEGKW